ncbi:sulfatase-like hydrolase/transferase [Jiangella asiatica]|uniref:Sulfatase n=1 Tax=Jiangella asiatica TaxID=2530372 RepID=A0A4R5D593_9ACTN|nr:sulfatase-like hydrolase/transferase [Jiangella asiatica]TDE08629.1 sulfatase [Jiangella asiatica]
MTAPPNIVVVLSDEHTPAATGCYGHPTVRTPNIDRLAAVGTLYESAYCASPMCVPSRLSLLSGRYVHDIGAWDNGVLPDPSVRSWGDHLRAAGYESVLAGRTHFNGADRLWGFDRRLSDDLEHWVDHSGRPPRRVPEWQRRTNSHVAETGVGEHPNTRHDETVTDLVVDYLTSRAQDGGERPFLLYVGYMQPHFPLVAAPEFAAWYDPSTVVLPPTRGAAPEDQHPVIAQLRRSFRNDEPLTDEQQRVATARYWALVSQLDHHVGRILDVIDESPLRDNTVIVYTSDHGEMLGHHGVWQKQCFYEPAVTVPLLVRTPAQARGAAAPARVAGDVSQVDLLPTLRGLAGLPADASLPGRDLLGATVEPRPVISEYHAQGMLDAGFMLKRGRYKYCAYVGHPPQLFDVVADPEERQDLAGDAAHAQVLAELDAQLRWHLDPDAVDHRAKADQRARAAAVGAQ